MTIIPFMCTVPVRCVKTRRESFKIINSNKNIYQYCTKYFFIYIYLFSAEKICHLSDVNGSVGYLCIKGRFWFDNMFNFFFLFVTCASVDG